MRQDLNILLPPGRDPSPDDLAFRFDRIQRVLEEFQTTSSQRVDHGIVSSLPTARARRGDTATIKPTTGIYWQFVHTGEATFPWAFIGGPAMRTLAANAGPTTLKGPTKTEQKVKVPVKGIYRVEASGEVISQVAELNETIAYALNAAAGSIAAAIFIGSTTFAGATITEGVEVELAAGAEVYSGFGSGLTKNTTYIGLRASVTPIRVL